MVSFRALLFALALAVMGGFFGGLFAVGIIGLDPAPFRTAPPERVTGLEPVCRRYDLRGVFIGPC